MHAISTVWSDAATQIFFSLGICQGSLLTMSSFNDFHDDVKRNAITVSIINCCTSFYLGFAIFTIVGFLAKQYTIPLDKIVSSGSSLIFIVYPTGLTQLPVAPLWCCIFFLMMFIVGVGSMIGCFQTVLAPLLDRFETLQRHQIKFRVIACLIGFACCLPMVCNGGFHLLDLVNTYGGGVNLLLLAIFELIAVAYIYGTNRLAEDIDMMWMAKKRRESLGEIEQSPQKSKTAQKRSRYWIVMWRYLTLIYLLFISLLWVINYSGSTGNAGKPDWSISLGWVFCALTLIPLPIVALVVWCRMGDSGVAAILTTKPMPLWGPVLEENRTGRYMDEEKFKDELSLLSFVETRTVKKDRMKKAKVKKGRYSTNSPGKSTDFDLVSHDGNNLVRYYPPKPTLKASKTNLNATKTNLNATKESINAEKSINAKTAMKGETKINAEMSTNAKEDSDNEWTLDHV